MHTTFPNNHFLITNSKNETVLEVHPIEENRDPERYYSLSIDRIPWTLHVYIPRINHIELQGKLIPFALLILFSFHFLYFLLKYFIPFIRQRILARDLDSLSANGSLNLLMVKLRL